MPDGNLLPCRAFFCLKGCEMGAVVMSGATAAVHRQCRHCKYSLASWIRGELRLMCLFWRRVAREACPEKLPAVKDLPTA